MGRLNPAQLPGVVPIMSPVPRRDSLEMRGRASTTASANGEGQPPHGLERVIESLKIENGELRKSLRELDDRRIYLSLEGF
jgi:hypothetical protein